MAFGVLGDAAGWATDKVKDAYGSKAGWILPGGFVVKGGQSLGFWGNQSKNQPHQFGNLPYDADYKGNMEDVNAYIDEVNNSQARDVDLLGAAHGARQAAYARGLEGPLAGSLEVSAQSQVRDMHNRARAAQLAQLYHLRGQLAMGGNEFDLSRQYANYGVAQQERMRQMARQAALLQLLGMGIGGSQAGPQGAQLGGQLGGQLPYLFGG